MAEKQITETFKRFADADAAWDAQLVAAFGSRSGDARYDERGRGQEGTPLRAAYEARMEAFRAYLAAQ